MTNLNIPNLRPSGSIEQQVTVLRNEVYNLTEQLRFSMSSIDQTNFSDAYKKTMKSAEALLEQLGKDTSTGGPLNEEVLAQHYKDLRDEIILNATEITQLFTVSIQQAENAIIAAVQEEYTAKSATAALQSLLTSMIEQTSTDVMIKFTEVNDYATSIEGMLNDFQQVLETYIRFSGDGITIGKLGSPFTARFDNEELGFYQNGIKLAYFSNNKLYVVWVETQKLTVGTPGQGFVDMQVEGSLFNGDWRDS